MPATSPTLSPTLSAIVAGLRGSSSGIPCSTLPTRSAPTSAALVKIPPPTRANNAWLLAPIPKQSMVTVISPSDRGSPNIGTIHFKIAYQTVISSKPKPTTVSPITAPERKATCSPASRLFWAPAAVRLLAQVAVFIPKKPASPEKKPPVMKAKGTYLLCTDNTNEAKNRSPKITTKNNATTLYC